MSSRTISNRTARRAAERQAAKAAAKLQKMQQNQQPTDQAVAATPVVETEAHPQVMSAAAGAAAPATPTQGFIEESTHETEPTPIRQLSELNSTPTEPTLKSLTDPSLPKAARNHR